MRLALRQRTTPANHDTSTQLNVRTLLVELRRVGQRRDGGHVRVARRHVLVDARVRRVGRAVRQQRRRPGGGGAVGRLCGVVWLWVERKTRRQACGEMQGREAAAEL